MIYCDNNKNSYYYSQISSAIFIKKDIFDEYQQENPITYFAFSEKLLEGKGFRDESSIHVEIKNDDIIRQYFNCDEQGARDEGENTDCDDCKYHFNESDASKETTQEIDSKLAEIIRKYCDPEIGSS